MFRFLLFAIIMVAFGLAQAALLEKPKKYGRSLQFQRRFVTKHITTSSSGSVMAVWHHDSPQPELFYNDGYDWGLALASITFTGEKYICDSGNPNCEPCKTKQLQM